MFSLLCRNGLGYNYEDYYEFSDNDIRDGDQQQSRNKLRWEKIFIMLEDSHMMQKMLLQANEELKMEISSLRNHIQKITCDISASYLRDLEETCRSINLQQNIGVDQNKTRLMKPDVQQDSSVQQLEETDEVKKKQKMEELKSVEMMDKTEKKMEKDKWWSWTNWGFWR
ncbi:hypothetical protein C0J45_5333 [Silurus meridionalis]|uniref:Uncharacterized protein n=1 Tax=Silurus meridionalis TaxID=175797 RepID=A0A8T0BKY1_SILME|nr:hypothetical protein HF521_019284 [Silurus meridionalis]KAI5103707.1 hypothetical protein C0J45_5333 [Silurus meridionalis]